MDEKFSMLMETVDERFRSFVSQIDAVDFDSQANLTTCFGVKDTGMRV